MSAAKSRKVISAPGAVLKVTMIEPTQAWRDGVSAALEAGRASRLPTPLRDYFGIFGRGFMVVALVASNTAQVAGGHMAGAGVVGFAISYLWFSNARVAGRTDLRYAREWYAAGAAAGTVFGMFVMRVIYGK
jgi:hypothetical protein